MEKNPRTSTAQSTSGSARTVVDGVGGDDADGAEEVPGAGLGHVEVGSDVVLVGGDVGFDSGPQPVQEQDQHDRHADTRGAGGEATGLGEEVAACEGHPAVHGQLRASTSGRSSVSAGAGRSTVGAWKRRRRLALPTTDSELAAIAAAAMIGDSSHPVNG